MQKHVEDFLSEELLKGNIDKGKRIIIDVENGEFAANAGEQETGK